MSATSENVVLQPDCTGPAVMYRSATKTGDSFLFKLSFRSKNVHDVSLMNRPNRNQTHEYGK